MLRCHVRMRRSLREKNSRKTSESGKIAPTISDQVRIRWRVTGFGPSMSWPRTAALAISAPAMPWVIVSMRESLADLPRVGRNSAHREHRRAFGHDFANSPGRDAVALQSGKGCFRRVRIDGDQKAA